MKVAIINSVPLNGGDEALLRATIFGLSDRFEDISISILCNNPKLANDYFQDLNFDWDWEYANDFLRKKTSLKLKLTVKFRKFLLNSFGFKQTSYLSQLLASTREKRTLKILSNADFVIASAGGYLHDFYGVRLRLETLNFIRNELQKKIYVFGQSIGPFWKTEQFKKIKTTLSMAEAIILREDISKTHLDDLGYQQFNTYVLNDIAFYLHRKYPFQVKQPQKVKSIIMNFREWEFEDEGKTIFSKALKTVRFLLNHNYNITFLSTCQGVQNYRDDSRFAEALWQKLEQKEKENCYIIKKHFSIQEFLEILRKHDIYIGMRLHGAILSMLAGIPALNIAYEDKTTGIFERLGISDSCFSYKREAAIWIDQIVKFIENYEFNSNRLKKVREIGFKDAEKAFEILNK